MTVTSLWSEATRWLELNAPGTLLGLAAPEPDAAARVAAAVGVDLPQDVVEWLGVVPSGWTALWGLHMPLPATSMISDSQMRLEIAVDVWGEDDEPPGPAGTPAHRYPPGLLSITSDGCGDALCVDLRPGARRGEVVEWDKVDGSTLMDNPRWAGLAGLLEDWHASLTRGVPFDRYWAPRVEGEQLFWEHVGVS